MSVGALSRLPAELFIVIRSFVCGEPCIDVDELWYSDEFLVQHVNDVWIALMSGLCERVVIGCTGFGRVRGRSWDQFYTYTLDSASFEAFTVGFPYNKIVLDYSDLFTSKLYYRCPIKR